MAQALTVLKDFYAEAAVSTAFAQTKDPEIFEDEYKGMQSTGSSVVCMFEVIESDFARLEDDTKAAEATTQKEYDELMTVSQVDKTQKATTIEHKTAKKQDEEQALTTNKEDLKGIQKELESRRPLRFWISSCFLSGRTFHVMTVKEEKCTWCPRRVDITLDLHSLFQAMHFVTHDRQA